MIFTVEEAREFHRRLIDRFGGLHGVRDMDALESALTRPLQEFDGHPLYPTAVERAAALIESLTYNHPFFDGIKRVSQALAELYLRESGIHLSATIDEHFEFAVSVASGQLKYDGILAWLSAHVK